MVTLPLDPAEANKKAENAIQISIVIPFLNEQDVLPICHSKLKEILGELGLPYEIVFVDDGSTDKSVLILTALMERDPRVRVVRLSRNFGKEAAMSAGLAHARGEAVIMLDADLQDPPALIPDMVKAWQDGFDVVSMRRRKREGEGFAKRLSAYAFYRIMSRLSRSRIPADTGDFRLMSRRTVEALLQMPERCRYMKGLYAWIGFPTKVIDYDRAPRAAGKTKWNYFALFGLALEGITSFSTAPLRWATGIGAVVALTGGMFGLWIIFKTIVFGHDVPGYPSLTAMITLLSGIQLLTIGLLGEYVGKGYMETKQRPIFIVRDVLEKATQMASQHAGIGSKNAVEG
ncbi:glycosyltransferase family 2 protein [Achromobacter sp. LC458]|uniref:Glycosyltransferase n=2 Tax=Achromobacter piechaudii TaxID=72556 RepID=A0ABN7EV03_9BURK|nr:MULTISPECIES: glycosyltransferase family 2 protein [Achromobacter]EFF78346.1 glycosyltransferase, group 2 family protein [Achromobacter piechaudii ATCC 43553]TRM54137.1 glycosyltransferase family 2 protein [Achromobacter sp. LC458]GLK94723.1 glycosyl transferase family 2 [Achromobacter xylosoxidans]CAB3670624.1 putative glycosyltransferase [Achromobacter piechaudii]